jgi:hypothetical protein
MFMGKGTYDYKNVDGYGDNYIPTWETQESLKLLSGTNSYCTDDFFARVDGDDLKPDLSFGRLTVKNSDQADTYIDKVIYYEQNSDRGTWRNLITLVADDGLTSSSENNGAEFTAAAEHLANTPTIIPPSFDFKKIYLANYPAVITGNGRRKPAVNFYIIK